MQQLKLLLIMFLYAFRVTSIPVSSSSKSIQEPLKRFGVVDLVPLIPGIQKNEVCSMCKRVLSAFKKDSELRAGQGQSNFRAFIDQECNSLSSNSVKYLPLDLLEPFCRELGNTLIEIVYSYSGFVTAFIEPSEHCEQFTFCAPNEE